MAEVAVLPNFWILTDVISVSGSSPAATSAASLPAYFATGIPSAESAQHRDAGPRDRRLGPRLVRIAPRRVL